MSDTEKVTFRVPPEQKDEFEDLVKHLKKTEQLNFNTSQAEILRALLGWWIDENGGNSPFRNDDLLEVADRHDGNLGFGGDVGPMGDMGDGGDPF